MPDTQLKLGAFVFADMEVPPSINFGGAQQLVVHKLAGGGRVIDDMGPDYDPISWGGLMLGPNALDRALYLDGVRKAGKPIELTVHQLAYQVVISHFRFDDQAFYKVPYQITVEVLTDRTRQVLDVPAGPDEMINNDFQTASTLAVAINDPTTTSQLSALQTAIQNVQTFAGATTATINSVLTPLAAVQSQVKLLIGNTGSAVQNATTLGGIVPGNPVSSQLSSISSSVNEFSQLPQLYNLQSVLNRMAVNLSGLQSVPVAKTVTVAGGDLMKIASTEYGDPTLWATIAQANGMSDPQFTGVKTLTIPPKPAVSNGGILGG